MKRRTLLQSAVAAAAVIHPLARASTYPSRFVKLVIPFAAGGSTDVLGRKLAVRLTDILGQSVVVENRSGSAGVVGCSFVAKSAPDGYTLLLGTTGTHAINPTSMSKPAYDAVKDFAPIALLGIQPMGIGVNPKVPAKNLQELLALIRNNPGKYSYASAGNGGIAHLSFELLKSLAGGLKADHIPYKGGAPALQDVVGGHVPILSDTFSSTVPHHRSGALRVLACCGPTRSPAAPDIPTAIEQGVAGMNTSTSGLFLAPAGTPADVIARLAEATDRALKLPAFQAELRALGMTAETGADPKRAAEFIRTEIAKWAPVVRSTGTKM